MNEPVPESSSLRAPAKNRYNDIITVVRDPAHTLGKHVDASGKKTANVMLSFGYAVQHHVPNAEAIKKLLLKVTADPHAALINASFPCISLGEEFVIMSKKRLSSHLGVTEDDKLNGVHSGKFRGKTYKVVGRFKENTEPSNWQYFDRDQDEHTPKQFADLDHDGWLAAMEPMFPGLGSAAKVIVSSSSARITLKGQPIGKNNAHTWVQFADANDVDRVRVMAGLRAMELDLAWLKPRMSHLNPGQIVGQAITCLTDLSVLNRGRIAFEGAPTVALPYKVSKAQITVTSGHRLNTSLVPSVDRRTVRAQGFRYGVSMTLNGARQGSQGCSIATDDLTWETELELEGGHTVRLSEAVKSLPPGGKLRCQTPFRPSTSMAAFLSRNNSGKPFVYDSGTGTTHWLCDAQSKQSGFAVHDVERLPYPELMAWYATLGDGDLEKEFAASCLHLTLGEREKVLQYVEKRTKLSRLVLRGYIKDAAQSQQAEMIRQAVGRRTVIAYTPENITDMATETEAVIVKNSPPEKYLVFGGKISQVIEQSMPFAHLVGQTGVAPPPTLQLVPFDDVAMLSAVEANVVFQSFGNGGPSNMEVPLKVLKILLNKAVHCAPVTEGLLPHPVVLPSGEIASEPGLHDASGLLFTGSSVSNLTAYKVKEAKAALVRIKTQLLEGFSFSTTLDADMAIAALLTAIQRRLMDMAPGFAFLAPVQSSGKTTLARVIHVILTGRDMPVSGFPEGNEEEMQKRLLAMLMRSPPMVCLDNVTDGMTFQSSALAQALTSNVLIQRILGVNKEATCITNVLFVVTGNNLSMGADEITRWLPVYLNPKTATPHTRQFKHPDVVSYARSIRDDVLRDCIGILAGFARYGTKTPPATRFPMWDTMIRQPLTWAGGEDASSAFAQNAQNSDGALAAEALLTGLHDIYQSNRFRAYDLTVRFERGPALFSNEEANIADALGSLKSRDIKNAKSVGRCLKSLVNRPVATAYGTLQLVASTIKGTQWYEVI